MSIKIGDKVVEKEFLLKETTPKEYTFKVALKKGEPKLELGFTNDVSSRKASTTGTCTSTR